MARTLSAILLAKQQGFDRIPAVRVLINGVNYSSRVLSVEHHEEPYRDYATIVLNNVDRGLDSVATLSSNLLGYRFRIAYGYYTGEIVAEPNGDGAGNEYVESADLWVKSQKVVSSPGQLECELYCEGQWNYLREQQVMALASVGEAETIDPGQVASDPTYRGTFNKTKTVYQLIESVIENAMGWALNAAPSPDDGILTSFMPVYTVEGLPTAGDVLADAKIGLIRLTKCYLRAKANLIWELVYPQSGDAIDEIFYSSQSPFFYEFAEIINLVTPNRIVVFADDPDDLFGTTGAWKEPVMVGDTGAYDATHPGAPDNGNYTEVIGVKLDATITLQGDANNRASAILSRLRAEALSSYLIAPHDCRVELYDKIRIVDTRGV